MDDKRPNINIPKIEGKVCQVFDHSGLVPFLEYNKYSTFIDCLFERRYLETISDRKDFARNLFQKNSGIQWICIDCLPSSPGRDEDRDLQNYWKNVLTSLHICNQRIIVVLSRYESVTQLYLGIKVSNPTETPNILFNIVSNNIPSIKFHLLDAHNNKEELDVLLSRLNAYDHAAAITGIPSQRKGENLTLDTLAKGIKDFKNHNTELNFSVLFIAEPITDADLSQITSKIKEIGTAIHSEVRKTYSETESDSTTKSSSKGFNLGFGAGTGQGDSDSDNVLQSIAHSIESIVIGVPIPNINAHAGFFYSKTKSETKTHGKSSGTEVLDKFAQYTEKVCDMHCSRLQKGHSLGFWNLGIYILTDLDTTLPAVGGILRAQYSGDETYLEPIRYHYLTGAKNALYNIKNFTLTSLYHPGLVAEEKSWHILGPHYQTLSTPINTEELAICTALPTKEVTGLSFTHQNVTFTNNAPRIDASSALNLGQLVNNGIKQNEKYEIDINRLQKHILIAGSSGCGKTNTAKVIANNVLRQQMPVLIIEPEKDEWIKWAIEYNQTAEPEQRFNIFTPTGEKIDKILTRRLLLNPFCPTGIEGAPVDIQSHCEKVVSILNSTMPMEDVLPILFEESIFQHLQDQISDFDEGCIAQLPSYPRISDILPTAQSVIQKRGYEERVVKGMNAAIETRIKYLTRGNRGKVLGEYTSTTSSQLFDRPCVINLSSLSNERDKALIMSLILLNLYEYRQSAYRYDTEYRQSVDAGKCQHLTIIEEAHSVLSKPSLGISQNNPQKVVADMFTNIISTIRGYGAGLMILDQEPTRLVEDVFSNTNYKIAHKLSNSYDCEIMARVLALNN